MTTVQDDLPANKDLVRSFSVSAFNPAFKTLRLKTHERQKCTKEPKGNALP